MTITFDLSTPKQVTFFRPMIDQLRQQNVTVRIVTRRYAELDVVIRQHGLRAKVLGSFGGPTLLGKLKRSAERVQLLASYFHRTSPDLLVTLSNAESIRAAYGLGIPVVCFNDLPESRAVSSLSLPLASAVCAPWIIPPRDFAEYGITRERLFRYRSLDPLVWLERHHVNSSYPEELGFDPHKPLIVFRETEVQSAYARRDIVRELFQKIKRRHSDWQLLNIPRYGSHPPYDVGSLLCQADLFVGGGGTMCIEAAYYGTAVVATRAMPCHYMSWLFRRNLADPCLTARDALRQIERIIDSSTETEADRRRKRAARVFSKIPFPLEETVQFLMGHASRRSRPE